MSSHESFQTRDCGDIILSEHWRLNNIEIVHSNGTNPKTGELLIKQKGFYSIDNVLDEPETIDSSKTPFEPLILLVKPSLLGTHEDTIGDPNRPQWIPQEYIDKGYTKSGFADINFLQGIGKYGPGWNGSPIAVAVFATCIEDKIQDNHIFEGIAKSLKAKGSIGILDSLVYGDLGILDGHHRAKVAAESKEQGLKYVPVQIIPYLTDKCVVLNTWNPDGRVWKGQQVFECFKVPLKFADAKRTKFGVIGTDGITRRILDTQPSIHIPLSNLI